jgi:hypothetical protein
LTRRWRGGGGGGRAKKPKSGLMTEAGRAGRALARGGRNRRRQPAHWCGPNRHGSRSRFDCLAEACFALLGLLLQLPRLPSRLYCLFRCFAASRTSSSLFAFTLLSHPFMLSPSYSSRTTRAPACRARSKRPERAFKRERARSEPSEVAQQDGSVA